MKVGVIAGHTAINPGNDFRAQEHQICRVVSEEIGELLDQAGVEVLGAAYQVDLDAIYALDNDAGLNAKVVLLNQARVDLAVEIHLNGGGGNYSCCLHHPNSASGRHAANWIARAYQHTFQWAAHGAQPETRYGRSGLAMLHHTHMPAVIAEPGFLDNEAQGWGNPIPQQLYAMATATGILQWVEMEA